MQYDYPQFWEQLLQKARRRTHLHSHLKPRQRNWLDVTIAPGLRLAYLARSKYVAVALYIDQGPGTEAANEQLFDGLAAARPAIEHAYGGGLLWERLPGRRACRITAPLSPGGVQDLDRWPEIQDQMIDAMVRIDAALRPHLATLSP